MWHHDMRASNYLCELAEGGQAHSGVPPHGEAGQAG